MPAPKHAQQSLQEEAEALLQAAFNDAPGPRRRVLWWDAGGYLRSVVERACEALGVPFIPREHPLAFRAWVAEQGATPEDEPERVVWYVPEAQNGRDWFRDVAHMGKVIKKGIEDLAADLYGIYPWQLRSWEGEGAVSQSIANILKDQLSRRDRPTLQRLQASLLTGDDSLPVEYILRDGWGRLPDDPDVVEKVRALLNDEHVPNLRPSSQPAAIVKAVRRWAVAGWLHHEGVPRDAFPRFIATSDLGYAHRRLKSVLETDQQTEVLSTYQKAYWPDAIKQLDDPWVASACPVDGALEAYLWKVWLQDFDAGAFAQCQERARERTEALRAATKRDGEDVGKARPPWIRAWRQAASLAELAHRYDTWADRDAPVHALYADREEGSWHIDAAVRRIIVSGTPEEDLSTDHPAREALATCRDALVGDRYLEYLQTLAGKMEAALQRGTLLDDTLRPSVTFWSDHSEALSAGKEAVLFYIDALRLDLARALADRLQERSDDAAGVHLTVRESTRLGVLPSETAFGMAAVLPGRVRAYEVKMNGGKLRAHRSGRALNTTRRHELLRNEGWTVAPHDASAWSGTRVAYMDTELDDIGENDLDQIEKKLAARIDELVRLIFQKMRSGNWSRAYVVTDHGFVLLPERTTFEALAPPEGDIKRRRVAAADAPDKGPGVRLTRERIPDLSYLASPVRILVDPLQRFKKQGLADTRFYHGGALPQECILSFLTIEAE
ncbi:BREX-5 system phosphatase PglZ [Salisaeta longa]|uniref:BREX-5 system phosphatase PglZ n=1 Tax=Salisaeta longa TaxID=503170 RepID=UPI0003B556EC|nr:BREX-5 system phosphatase PglZ [Salisaeta longa]